MQTKLQPRRRRKVFAYGDFEVVKVKQNPYIKGRWLRLFEVRKDGESKGRFTTLADAIFQCKRFFNIEAEIQSAVAEATV